MPPQFRWDLTVQEGQGGFSSMGAAMGAGIAASQALWQGDCRITSQGGSFPSWGATITGGSYCPDVSVRAYCPGPAPYTNLDVASQSCLGCPDGQFWVPGKGCIRYVDDNPDRPKCNTCPCPNGGYGNPIFPLTGAKTQTEDLGIKIGGLSLQLTFDTRWKLPGASSHGLGSERALASFGPMWRTNVHKVLVLQAADGVPGSAYSAVVMQRGGGVMASATVNGFGGCSGSGGGGSSAYASKAYPNLKADLAGTTRLLTDGDALLQETYGSSGEVLTVASAKGQRLTYSYSVANTPATIAPVPGLLIKVEDQFGRTVEFNYEQPADTALAPRIVRVIYSDGQAILAAYNDVGDLSSLTWADGTVRTFMHERPDLPWAMTGIVDENAKRHSTYGYDGAGRAVSTQLTGGVDSYQVTSGSPPGWSTTETQSGNTICREHSWQAPSGTVLTTPQGQASNLDATVRQGMVSLNAKSQPAGSGCNASVSAQDYDEKGNVKQYDDFNGNRTCYFYDATRNLRTVTLEGLPSTTACPVSLPGYVPAPPQRMVTTAWHPDWALEVKRAEPGRITTNVYNGQPDPFNGGAAANCAPAAAVLPDGKPLALLCKKVQQATTDIDGRLGVGAPLKVGVPNRQTTWTYNQFGQVLTEDGPRTDVIDVTTYQYYAETTADHTMGDLEQVTDAAGKVTRYTKYNKYGQMLESVDPNNAVAAYTYDLRQRLLSINVGGHATAYAYDAAGQLKKMLLPDGSWIGYDYDDAHRQVAVYDHQGNRTEYVLDNAGNRIGQSTRDADGALRRQLARSIDALGRVQQTTGRE